jgi:ubiquinone/menaquinone biosynthesis C-methylase UbiE
LNVEHNNYFAAENPDRRKWQNPEAILAEIGLKAGLTFIDVGCGGGFFSLPAARIIYGGGNVYGIDINSSYIDELRELAAKENLHNMQLTVGKAEEVVICDSCGDIIFFGVVLHDFDDAASVLKNAKRMLKPNGRLVDLDWKREPMELGPRMQKRFSVDYSARLINNAGFRIENIKDAGRYHYMITASNRD